MTSLFRLSASVLVAAMLAGCGAQGLAPVAAQQKSLAVAATMSVDPGVEKLIADFKAIAGYDDQAMAKRATIIATLGESDSDLAMQFLEDQYNRLGEYPEAVRAGWETKLGDAMVSLDTYDEELDEEAISEGPGSNLVQAEAYYDAMTRRKRHKGFVGWVSNGWHKFWAGLTGKKLKKKRRRRPTPAPSYPSDPSQGNPYGGGTYPSNGYRY
ncbi:MAG: hypothetical protein JWM80_3270 [Cyanobacteria bacterium RYN_339]|nr:hypothetical protein [Cyanobacteria bacterium RYN_339]